MAENHIRVLLVDDSPVAIALMKRMLAPSPEITVVGAASNGKEALELLKTLGVDVITVDLHMPVMDGYEFTAKLMGENPKPILVVSVSVQESQSRNIFSMLEAGALDVFPKPRSGIETDFLKHADELISKIKILSGVHVFKMPRSYTVFSQQARKNEPPPAPNGPLNGPLKIIAIGASTGGPQALSDILRTLPHGFPAPIVCVQHISDGFVNGLVEWLGSLCALRVELAKESDEPRPGVVYFPHEDAHLLIDNRGRFKYSNAPAHNGHRPSITVTFKSVAQYYGKAAAGVLLTGMGEDGAEGMQAIAMAGGLTVAQDEKTCVVYGMPKHAQELNAAQFVLPPDGIAALIASRAGLGATME